MREKKMKTLSLRCNKNIL